MAIKIYIDAGHNPGNVNAGASGNGIVESQINFTVATMLAQLLDNDCRFAVRTSRTYPQQVVGTSTLTSLQERVDSANGWNADYFISIHTNYSDNPNIQGSEVYVYKEYSKAWYLAQDVLKNLVKSANTKDNQVRMNPSLYVLRKTKMPAILVELGYLTNLEDAQKLKDDPYSFAYGIYLGIVEYVLKSENNTMHMQN